MAQLAPDVRKAFPDDEAVNEALRNWIRVRELANVGKKKSA